MKKIQMNSMFSTSALMLLGVAASTGCVAEEDTQSQSMSEDSSESVRGIAKLPHCIANAVAQRQGEATPQQARVSPVQCFETFSDAISAATNGRVRLPPSATPSTVDEQTLNGGSAALFSNFVIGIEYADPDFRGASLTFTSGVTCDNFVIRAADLPSFGFNDVISSARAFSNCNNSFHYDDINFGGAVINCGAECSYIGGALNDRTSSIIWRN
jgi:hypothetical protein